MFRFYGFGALLYFALYVYAVLDVVLSEATLVRNLQKSTWVFLVLLFVPVGTIAWFVAGRPSGATLGVGAGTSSGRQTGRNASTRGNPTRNRPTGNRPAGGRPSVAPKGPDDDPDFMRRLDQRMRDAQPMRDESSEAADDTNSDGETQDD